jgi:hypothetical protein
MKNLVVIFPFVLATLSCGQPENKPMSDTVKALNEFKSKPKFEQDSTSMYTGLGDKRLKPLLTSLINKAADDFIEVVNSNPTPDQFRGKIKVGLDRFTPYTLRLDTDDRERVCLYYQELMDIVGLESSEGILNNWLYGFDPTKRK